jgi:hypothetical protein
VCVCVCVCGMVWCGLLCSEVCDDIMMSDEAIAAAKEPFLSSNRARKNPILRFVDYRSDANYYDKYTYNAQGHKKTPELDGTRIFYESCMGKALDGSACNFARMYRVQINLDPREYHRILGIESSRPEYPNHNCQPPVRFSFPSLFQFESLIGVTGSRTARRARRRGRNCAKCVHRTVLIWGVISRMARRLVNGYGHCVAPLLLVRADDVSVRTAPTRHRRVHARSTRRWRRWCSSAAAADIGRIHGASAQLYSNCGDRSAHSLGAGAVSFSQSSLCTLQQLVGVPCVIFSREHMRRKS